jgi:hypothetical protein
MIQDKHEGGHAAESSCHQRTLPELHADLPEQPEDGWETALPAVSCGDRQ